MGSHWILLWERSRRDTPSLVSRLNPSRTTKTTAGRRQQYTPPRLHHQFNGLHPLQHFHQLTKASGSTAFCVTKSIRLSYICPKFINMPVLQRSDHLKANHLCFNCLAPGHKTAECRSLSRCRSCQGRHHTMVHRDVPTSSAANNAILTAVTHVVSTAAPPSLQSSLTMTSQVLPEGPSGRKLVCRALFSDFDQSSQQSPVATIVCMGHAEVYTMVGPS